MQVLTRTGIAMDTLVMLRVDSALPPADVEEALDRALGWFATVEVACSRFDPASELSHLCAHPGERIHVGSILSEAVAFALNVARATNGAFDPTIGFRQQQRGFLRSYRTGRVEAEPAGLEGGSGDYRDVVIDRRDGTILLRRPLLLDLGAVAKGLAIDLAVHELAGFERRAVEAGGDLCVGGRPPPWRIGIPDPARPETLLGTIALQDGAVCTSGGYERPAGEGNEHHLLNPRTGRSPRGLASATVVAPGALVADALATAAFVLGPAAGLRLLEGQHVDGLLVTPGGELRMTPAFVEHQSWDPFG